MKKERTPIAWITLRDGIAPIFGLAPDDIKLSSGHTREYRDFKLVSRQNAICKQLGFDRGLREYETILWPALRKKMDEHSLRKRVDLLKPLRYGDAWFAPGRRSRRTLADRLFFGPGPFPTHVFTGYDYDIDWWETLFQKTWSSNDFNDPEFSKLNRGEKRVWLHERSQCMQNIARYFGNVYFKPRVAEDPNRIVSYWPSDQDAYRETGLANLGQYAEAFHTMLSESEEGWCKIIKLTENLVALKGPNGLYDLVWRNLRDSATPAFDIGDEADCQPSSVLEVRELYQRRFRQLGVWRCKDNHHAELKHYARAVTGTRYPGIDTLIEAHLRDELLSSSEKSGHPKSSSKITSRFDQTNPHTQKVLSALQISLVGSLNDLRVSGLVTRKLFSMFLDSSAPRDSKVDTAFYEANDMDGDHTPVGMTYSGVLAYCAWLEKELAIRVRLLTETEHRMLRPSLEYQPNDPEAFDKKRLRAVMYDRAVLWSSDDESTESKVNHARWVEPVRFTEHGGLQFMDAIDAPEWCMNGVAAGLASTDGYYGDDSDTWGEYKRKKFTFRVVVDWD